MIILSNLHKNLSLGEAILMSTHNIGFYEEISKIMSPQPKGGGDILFLVRIPSASAAVSASALLRFRALSFEPMDGF